MNQSFEIRPAKKEDADKLFNFIEALENEKFDREVLISIYKENLLNENYCYLAAFGLLPLALVEQWQSCRYNMF